MKNNLHVMFVRGIIFFLSMLTGVAICFSRISDRIIEAIIVLLLYLFYREVILKEKYHDIHLSRMDYFMSFCFACGLEMMKHPSYIFTIISSKTQIIKSGIAVIGYWVFIVFAVKMVHAYLIEYSVRCDRKTLKYSPNMIWKWISVFVFIFGLPYLYAFYPGGVFSDMFSQISSYYAGTISNHHPVLITYLNGFIVQLGAHINDNFGIFLCNLIQYMLFVLTVGYVLEILYQLTGNGAIVAAGLLFYVFVPAFYHFSYLLVKDSLYAPLFTLYCCLALKLLFFSRINKREWIAFAVLNILLLLVRKEGVYVVLISTGSLLCAFFKNIKARKNILCILALILCVNTCYHNIFLKIFHINEGNPGDILAIPFLQTSLYIKCAGDDMTEEESDVLQTVFGEDLKEIGELYNPTVSDNLKGRFNFSLEKSDYIQYFNTYVKLGLRHPGIYLRALLEHVSAYIFPEGYRSWYAYYLDGLEEKWKSPYLNVYSNPNPNAKIMREFYRKYVGCWGKLPLISLFTSPGFYTWCYLFLFMLLCHVPNKKYLTAFIPIVCVIGVCCISPVNGYTRYFIPVEMALPIYVGYTLRLYVSSRSEQAPTGQLSDINRI